MDWIKCEDKLPESPDIDVIGYGDEWEEVDGVKTKEDLYEIGFRSAVDDPDKPYTWIDFSFKVTHWAYLQPHNRVDAVCACGYNNTINKNGYIARCLKCDKQLEQD